MGRLRCRAAAWVTVGWVAGCDATPPPLAPTDAGAPADVQEGFASTDAGAPPDIAEDAPAPQEEAQPPPIAGGTLAITADGATAVASDPDGDRVLVVDLTHHAVTAALALRPGDEPGRVAIGGGRAFVALRGGGAVVTVDLARGALSERRSPCAHPRGLAWDGAAGALHVACMGGELVTLPPEGEAPVRRAQLDRDLRDVVVLGDRLAVSRLRSAEVLIVDGRGAVTQRIAATAPARTEAGVARRMVAAPGGGVWLLHQRAGTAPVTVSTTGYYSATVTCAGTEGVTRPALSRLPLPGDVRHLPDLPDAALAVDVAVNRAGTALAVAVPGAFGSARPQVISVAVAGEACATVAPVELASYGQAVAVAFAGADRLVVQQRLPAALVVDGQSIALGGVMPRDSGSVLFHTNRGGTVACAACHVEGEDDGRVWTFAPAGARRTPSLRGGLLGTEPFHWSGDLPDFTALVDAVMVRGMRAPRPSEAGIDALARWIDRLPRRAAAAPDADAVARGEALFRDETTACATCHSGPHFTNGATVDVGTGEALQVPALHGLAWRAPYLHNGCAPTLRDRFGACGGGDRHGRTSHLTPAQLGDLVAYLDTL
ncbi:MAG: cytochrome-c peroxidase [Polyangiales bacterium]